jgi:hypothetical protein
MGAKYARKIKPIASTRNSFLAGLEEGIDGSISEHRFRDSCRGDAWRGSELPRFIQNHIAHAGRFSYHQRHVQKNLQYSFQ